MQRLVKRKKKETLRALRGTMGTTTSTCAKGRACSAERGKIGNAFACTPRLAWGSTWDLRKPAGMQLKRKKRGKFARTPRLAWGRTWTSAIGGHAAEEEKGRKVCAHPAAGMGQDLGPPQSAGMQLKRKKERKVCAHPAAGMGRAGGGGKRVWAQAAAIDQGSGEAVAVRVVGCRAWVVCSVRPLGGGRGRERRASSLSRMRRAIARAEA
jgi:hypothetical protein